MRSCCQSPEWWRAGFSLIEVCLSVLVLLLVLSALNQAMSSVSRSWSAADDPFGEASTAFETITQSLAHSTLEPYSDYADAGGAFSTSGSPGFAPDHLARRSDLAFVCGPGISLLAGSNRTTATDGVFFVEPGGETVTNAQDGLNHLFNARGFFVEFGPDTDAPSFFLGTPRLRWRLKEIAQPSESLQVFGSTSSAPWVSQLTGPGTTTDVLAENVIALVILPEPAANDGSGVFRATFAYDSRDTGNALTFAQLPPRVHVVLAAIDEASAGRAAAQNGTTAPTLVPPRLFQDPTQLDSDLATLDISLTAARVRHRFFQRDLDLLASSWSASNP